MSKKLVRCECGCGKELYFNQLVLLEVQEASDKTLRKTKTHRRFFVTPQCREPFTDELALMEILQALARAWAPKKKTVFQELNIVGTFINWCRRMSAARQVLRIQHGIWERTKGFDYARKRALRSAFLFGCPRFMQGFLAKRFAREDRLEKLLAGGKDAVPQEAVPVRSLD
jgi:hypothetical protein